MTASDYRRGGRDAEIRFALAQCALGAILVAQSARGICAIALGDDPETLLRDLQDRFPQARLIGGDAAFEALVRRGRSPLEAVCDLAGVDPAEVLGNAGQTDSAVAFKRGARS